jgi:hypothetical protein
MSTGDVDKCLEDVEEAFDWLSMGTENEIQLTLPDVWRRILARQAKTTPPIECVEAIAMGSKKMEGKRRNEAEKEEYIERSETERGVSTYPLNQGGVDFYVF